MIQRVLNHGQRCQVTLGRDLNFWIKVLLVIKIVFWIPWGTHGQSSAQLFSDRYLSIGFGGFNGKVYDNYLSNLNYSGLGSLANIDFGDLGSNRVTTISLQQLSAKLKQNNADVAVEMNQINLTILMSKRIVVKSIPNLHWRIGGFGKSELFRRSLDTERPFRTAIFSNSIGLHTGLDYSLSKNQCLVFGLQFPIQTFFMEGGTPYSEKGFLGLNKFNDTQFDVQYQLNLNQRFWFQLQYRLQWYKAIGIWSEVRARTHQLQFGLKMRIGHV